MNKFFLFLTILFFTFSILKAETVNKIIIDGNKRVSIETIKLYGEIEINKVSLAEQFGSSESVTSRITSISLSILDKSN